MQIIFIDGPVRQIRTLHVGYRSLFLIICLIFILIWGGLFFAHIYENNRQAELANIDFNADNLPDKEHYLNYVKKIQAQFAENKKKLKALEDINKKLLQLNVPQYVLDTNPTMKNKVLHERMATDASGGPFIPPTIGSLADLKNIFERYSAVLESSNQHLNEKLHSWSDEMNWIERQPIAYPIKESGHLSSGYGKRKHPFNNAPSLHTGLDFAAPIGTIIYATAGGIVVQAGWNGFYGLSVEVAHGNGLKTRYAHTSKILVTPGARVLQNQPIAQVGTTGRSTGPHLHYEILQGNQFTNPLVMLPGMQSSH